MVAGGDRIGQQGGVLGIEVRHGGAECSTAIAARRPGARRSAFARKASHMNCDSPARTLSMLALKRGSLTYSSPSPGCRAGGQG